MFLLVNGANYAVNPIFEFTESVNTIAEKFMKLIKGFNVCGS